MIAYIVRRLASAFLVVVLTSMFVFALFYLGPSDPASQLCHLHNRCNPQKQAFLEHAMGRDQSVEKNYADFLGGLAHSRTIYYGAEYTCHAPCLGISYGTQEEVTRELASAYPATLSLAAGGALLYLVVGVSTGALAARWRGSFMDRFLVSSSLIVSSIPYYLLALVAWIFLYLDSNIFPETKYVPITHSLGGWFDGLLLPWLVLGITGATTYTRFARGSMIESLEEDYIRTAVAKGASTRRAVFGHALRASMAPVLTLYGLDVAGLLVGTIFTEYIFSINGIGLLSLQSIKTPVDFPILNATVLFGAVLVVLGNLAVDVLYVFIDPRVKL